MERPGRKFLLICCCLVIVAAAGVLRVWLYQRASNRPPTVDKNSENRQTEEAVIVHFHSRRPFYMTDGNRVFGLVIDPIARAFEGAEIPYIWRETPAKRQLDIIARNNDRSCGAGWFKTPERERYARYTLPIYRDKPFVAVLRADDEYLLKGETSVDAVLKEWRLKLLVKEGYSYGHFIDERLQALMPRQVTTTGENLDILKMIASYRADYSFMTEEEALDLLSSPEVKGEHFKLVRFTDMPQGGRRYLICSKQVGAEVIARLDQAIRKQLQVDENP
jgi:polar amino acid transport system substrate-binding protein